MTLQDIMDLEFNTPVTYVGLGGLLFKGIDDSHLILEDKNGYRTRIYIGSFTKYGKIL